MAFSLQGGTEFRDAVLLLYIPLCIVPASVAKSLCLMVLLNCRELRWCSVECLWFCHCTGATFPPPSATIPAILPQLSWIGLITPEQSSGFCDDLSCCFKSSCVSFGQGWASAQVSGWEKGREGLDLHGLIPAKLIKLLGERRGGSRQFHLFFSFCLSLAHEVPHCVLNDLMHNSKPNLINAAPPCAPCLPPLLANAISPWYMGEIIEVYLKMYWELPHAQDRIYWEYIFCKQAVLSASGDARKGGRTASWVFRGIHPVVGTTLSGFFAFLGGSNPPCKEAQVPPRSRQGYHHGSSPCIGAKGVGGGEQVSIRLLLFPWCWVLRFNLQPIFLDASCWRAAQKNHSLIESTSDSSLRDRLKEACFAVLHLNTTSIKFLFQIRGELLQCLEDL